MCRTEMLEESAITKATSYGTVLYGIRHGQDESHSTKIWLLCVASGTISHPSSKSKKGRAIWLTGSARELLITSHVIELRSQPRQTRRGRNVEQGC